MRWAVQAATIAAGRRTPDIHHQATLRHQATPISKKRISPTNHATHAKAGKDTIFSISGTHVKDVVAPVRNPNIEYYHSPKMKKLFSTLFIVFAIGSIFDSSAQTTNIIVNNSNNTTSYQHEEYYINGIPKSHDIGGVDISATTASSQRAVNNRGFASNDYINFITSLNLTNHNNSAVTVILKVCFKTTVGMKPYPRYFDEQEYIYNIVLGRAGSADCTKSIECSRGNDFDCAVINADMIVRKIQN